MRARSAARRTVDWLRSVRPAPLLAALVLAQFGVVARLAFNTPHNGWIWYSGGDATEYWASQWAVGHGLIPPAYLGWGLPVLYAWIPLATGVSLLQGLPVVVLFHTLILGPLALVLAWALADLLYGRLYAWSVGVLWVIAPLLAIWAFGPRYQARFEEVVLAPHWAGLTDMADFPSLVLVLAAAWASVRAVQNGRFGSGMGAGVFGGLALGVKPSNGYFLAAVAVLLLAWKRPRVALGWVVGSLPALLTLAIWKARGRGNIPVLSAYTPRHEAAGSTLGLSANRYLPFDWHRLSVEWGQLREVFWDLRFLQFLLIAAALGSLRRDPRKGLFLITWFVAYCVLKGMTPQANIPTASYFRLTLPGMAALVLLIPSIGFLWPGTRRASSSDHVESWSLKVRSPLVPLAACVTVVPLAVVLFAPLAPAAPPRLVRVSSQTEAPISTILHARVHASRGVVKLFWNAVEAPAGTKIFYGVIRARGNDGCTFPTAGAAECQLDAPFVTWTEDIKTTDQPGRGSFWYRIAVVADSRAYKFSTDILLVGPAMRVKT